MPNNKWVTHEKTPPHHIQWLKVYEFKKGRTSSNYEPHSRRTAEVATTEIIETIHKIVLEKRSLKLSEIETVLFQIIE